MDIDIHMGNMAVATEPNNLITSGVGSCLVVTLYDPKRKIGALAHTMFPLPSTQNAEHETRLLGSMSSEIPQGQQPFLITEQVTTKTRETKYIDVAIDEMLKRMESQGTRREDLEAKLIGGANMFPYINSDIGKDNVSSAKKN
jgi:chemotaxis protein CheD